MTTRKESSFFLERGLDHVLNDKRNSDNRKVLFDLELVDLTLI